MACGVRQELKQDREITSDTVQGLNGLWGPSIETVAVFAFKMRYVSKWLVGSVRN